MSFGKWAALIGGFALSPFTGGASIPVGTAIAGALDQHDAAKTAVGQQQTATNQAASTLAQGNQAAQQQIAGAQQGITSAANSANAALAPYQQLGGQSANALSTLMGFGGLSAPSAPSGASAAPAASAGVPQATAAPVSAPSGEPGGHQTLASFVTDDNATRDMPPSLARALQIRQQNQSSYAKVQGPDGRFYNIPPDQLENALAAGGKRIG